MSGSSARYRAATGLDAPVLATLIDIAGEGLPRLLWGRIAEPGEDWMAVGTRRAAREDGIFSYRNALVAEVDGEVVACLIGHPLPDAPAPIDDATPAMFVPLLELENLACGSWYINALAALPARRGHGHGAHLLGLAAAQATRRRRRAISLIVSDANAGARRLYERCGYGAGAERPMVKEDWDGLGERWLLMTKFVGPA